MCARTHAKSIAWVGAVRPLFPDLPLQSAVRSSRTALRSARLRWLSSIYVVLVVALAGTPRASAQSASTGALGGVVHDPAGAALPAARLQLTSAADAAPHIAITDRLGEFLISDLPPGDYTLQVSALGFDTLRITTLTVELGRTARIAPTLRIATQSQLIQVQAEEPLASLDSPVNANLSPAELAALPLDGRRFQSLAILTPLVAQDDAPPAPGGAAPDTDNVRLTARGLHPMLNSYRLDGMSLTRAFDGEPRGGRSIPFAVALEGVREFQVRVAGASFGHDAGASVNTVTRRGEERLHGTAFGFVRDSGIGAANPFAYAARYNNGSPTLTAVKPHDIREQFGGSVGGPLPTLHMPAFGFIAAEGQRRSFPGIAAPSDPGFFTLTAVQTALLANRGVSPAGINTALNVLDGLMGSVDRRADEFALLPRLDLRPSHSSTLAAEWAHVRFRSPSGRHTAPIEPRGRASFGNTITHADTGILMGTVAVSPRWLLDIRAAYSRDAEFATSPAPLPTEPHSGPGGSAPEVSIAGDFLFGNADGTSARRLPDERRTQIAARAVYSGRAHTINAGIEVSGIDTRISAREGSSGAYDYTSGATNGRDGGLVDFITDTTYSATSYPNGGCPSIFTAAHFFCFRSFTQTFGAIPETRFHTAAWGIFAADTLRLTPRLQLTAGVLYNYARLPPPQHANTALDFGNVAATGTMPSDTNNLAPHAGIAYALNARTVIRLDYSIHFGAVPGRTLQAVLENTAEPTSQTSLRITPRTLIDPACASVGANFGYPATYTCSPFGPLAADSAATVFARGFQLPTVQIAELSVTRELTRHDSLSGAYIMSLDRQLQNTTDLNIAPATSRITFNIVRNGGEPGARGGDVYNVPLYTARLSPLFGPVTGILSNGNGAYHALALQAEHRASHALTARLAWTYAKSLDNVRSPGATPNENAQFDPFQPLYDRSPSNFDRRHRVVASAVWQPQLTHGEQRLRRVANGWSISPLLLFSSGRPYSYTIVGGTSLPGGRERLNGSGGAAYLPTIGANTLRLPWTQDVDLRILRSFDLHDHVRLRATAEAFNLLNHVNVTAVQQRAFLVGTAVGGITPLTFQDAATIAAEGLTTQAFGTPTSSSDSPTRERRIQFGLRIEW